MNEPIISPWIFYIGDLVNNFNGLVIFSTLVCSVGAFICLGTSTDYYEDTDKHKMYIKFAKRFCIGALVSLFIFLVLPTKTTYYNMVVASKVTYENVAIAKELTKEGFEYVLDKIVETAIKIQKGGK